MSKRLCELWPAIINPLRSNCVDVVAGKIPGADLFLPDLFLYNPAGNPRPRISRRIRFVVVLLRMDHDGRSAILKQRIGSVA